MAASPARRARRAGLRQAYAIAQHESMLRREALDREAAHLRWCLETGAPTSIHVIDGTIFYTHPSDRKAR